MYFCTMKKKRTEKKKRTDYYLIKLRKTVKRHRFWLVWYGLLIVTDDNISIYRIFTPDENVFDTYKYFPAINFN
jgi:hypothetical protein